MKYMRYLFIVLFFTSGCENKNYIMDFTAPEATRFSIKVDQGISFWDSSNVVWVNFSTSDFSEVPKVLIENHTLKNWFVSGLGYTCNYSSIPFQQQFQFSIEKSGAVTPGEIQMPAFVRDIKCNGVLLTGVNDSVPSASSYTVTWECDDYDYFLITTFSNSNIYTVEKSFELPSSSDLLFIRIKSVKGKTNKEGETPNFTGEYGYGFISASCQKEVRFFVKSN